MQLTRLLSERRRIRRAATSPCTLLLCEDGAYLLCEDDEPILLAGCETTPSCPALLCQDGVPLLTEDGLEILLTACAEVITHTTYVETMIGEADLIGDLFVDTPHNRLRGRGRLAAVGAILRKQFIALTGYGRFHNPVKVGVTWVAGAQLQGESKLKALSGGTSTGVATFTAKGRMKIGPPTFTVPTARLQSQGDLTATNPVVEDIGIILRGTGGLVVGDHVHWQTYRANLWRIGDAATLKASPTYFMLLTGAAMLVGEGKLVHEPPSVVLLAGTSNLAVATAFFIGAATCDAYGDLYAMGGYVDLNATRPVSDGYLYPAEETYEVIDCGEYGNGVFPDFNEEYDGDFYDAASDG